MEDSILILVDSDPRASSRPGEALRVAAGLGANGLPVQVCLRNAAGLLVEDVPDDLVDGDIVAQYLPVVVESGRPILVQGTAAWESSRGPWPTGSIDDAGLAALVRSCAYLLRF